jgi:hypothetical protein
VTESNPDNTGTGGYVNGVGGYGITGSRTDSVTFLLDGSLNNNLLDNAVVFNPNPDTSDRTTVAELMESHVSVRSPGSFAFFSRWAS